MAKQNDKHRKVPPTVPTNTDRNDPKKDDGRDPGKDADTYDPVGMAGKKAGIVEPVEDAQKRTEEGDGKRSLGTTGWRTGM